MNQDACPTPGLFRRLGSLLYDTLTVMVLLLLASAIVTFLSTTSAGDPPRLLLQCTAVSLVAGYFWWCWTHSGQTLAMKTWHIRVIRCDGSRLRLRDAVTRLLLAIPSLALGGLGLWWALFDHDRQFLHDRLARTRLVRG